MPGAFTGTASSTTSQMEKMLRVFLPLYEKQMQPGNGEERRERQSSSASHFTAASRLPILASSSGGGVERDRARRRRDRARRRCIRAQAEWRPDRDGKLVGAHSSRSD